MEGKEGLNKRQYRELKRAVTRALTKVMKSIKDEPSPIVYCDATGGDLESQVSRINSWLFRRRCDNGSSGS